jgi:hypothetical protein
VRRLLRQSLYNERKSHKIFGCTDRPPRVSTKSSDWPVAWVRRFERQSFCSQMKTSATENRPFIASSSMALSPAAMGIGRQDDPLVGFQLHGVAYDLARHGRPVKLMRRRQPLMGRKLDRDRSSASHPLCFEFLKIRIGKVDAYTSAELAGTRVMTTPQAWSAPITVR